MVAAMEAYGVAPVVDLVFPNKVPDVPLGALRGLRNEQVLLARISGSLK